MYHFQDTQVRHSWELAVSTDELSKAAAFYLGASPEPIRGSQQFETAILKFGINRGECPSIPATHLVDAQASFLVTAGGYVNITYRNLKYLQVLELADFYNRNYPKMNAAVMNEKSTGVPTISLDYSVIIKNVLVDIKKYQESLRPTSAAVQPQFNLLTALANAPSAYIATPVVKPEVTRFLRDNAVLVNETLEQVFAGTEGVTLQGKLVYFQYTDGDSSAPIDFNPNYSGENRGPGFRVKIAFMDIVKRFYYPENECPTIESFLDNLNTDFCMAQIRNLPPTNSLNIITYDLAMDTIKFKLDYPHNYTEIVSKGFSTCWNPNTLEFNIDNFLELKRIATLQEEQKQIASGHTRSGGVSKGLYAEEPKPVLPKTFKALGIDKAKFLQTKVEKDNARPGL